MVESRGGNRSAPRKITSGYIGFFRTAGTDPLEKHFDPSSKKVRTTFWEIRWWLKKTLSGPSTPDEIFWIPYHGRIQRWWQWVWTPPPPPQKITKNIGFLCNTCPDYLKNHKATKPAFNVGPSSARQRNAISMAFRWRADDVPFKAEFGSSPPPPQLKKNQIWTPPPPPVWQNFLEPRMAYDFSWRMVGSHVWVHCKEFTFSP